MRTKNRGVAGAAAGYLTAPPILVPTALVVGVVKIPRPYPAGESNHRSELVDLATENPTSATGTRHPPTLE